MPDGDIVLTVALDTKDLQAKLAEIKRNTSQMFNSANASGFNNVVKSIIAQMNTLAASADGVVARLQKMQTAQIANPEIRATTQELEKLQETYRGLYDIYSALSESKGVAFDPSSVQELVELNNQIEALQQKLATLNQTKPQISGAELHPEKYQELQQKLLEYVNQLAVANARAREHGNIVSSTGSRGSQAYTSLSKSVQNAFGNTGRILKSAGEKVGGVFGKLKNTVEQTFSQKNFKRGLTTILKYGLGVRSLYFLFRRLRNAVKEGLQNLVKYEKAVGESKNLKSTNQAITNLRTSLLYLKNAWAAAFAPIITAVMPLLTTLIDGIANAANYIARFVGALTGQVIVLNAVKTSAGDYADSLDNTAKSAGGASKAQKKLNDRLAQFDDLNVLGKDDDSGSGAGSGAGGVNTGADPAKMFTAVQTGDSLVDMIKKAWEEADFSELGALLKDKIIGALESINWDEVKGFVVKIAKSFGTFLEGLLGDPKLYESIGKTFAEVLNTINDGLEEFLKHTKNIKLGQNLAKGLNKFLDVTNFKKAGDNIHEIITQITDNISDFVDTLDADKIIKAITDFIEGLDIPDMVANVRSCALKVASLVIEVTSKLVVTAGENVGNQWFDEVTKGIEDTVGDKTVVLNNKFKVDEHPIRALVDDILTKIGQAFTHAVIDLGSLFGSDPEKTFEGFSKGFDAWIEGGKEFYKVFGELTGITKIIENIKELHSAGSDFANWVTGVYEKFTVGLNVITNTFTMLKDDFLLGWNAITSAVSEGAGTIGTAFTNIGQFFTELGKIFSLGWEEATRLFNEGKDAIASCISSAEDKVSELRDDFSQKWSDIKSGAESAWSTVTTTISNAISNAVQSAKNKASELKTDLQTTWINIKANASEQLLLMKAKFVEVFNNIKEGLKTPVNGIIGIVESLVNKIISAVNSIVDKLNNLPSLQFKNPFNGQDYKLGFNIPKLSKVSIPRLAQGAVIPPNKEFMAMLGDQSHGTNIEAPLDTIKQAVAEVMANNGSAEMIQLLQQLITVVENKNLVIGDKEIGKANARYSNQQRIIRGTSF